jgi:hypothetical protein
VAGAVNLVIAKPGMSAGAIPIGVGQGIGFAIKKELGGGLGQRNPFGSTLQRGDELPEDSDDPGRWGGHGTTRLYE